MQRRQLLRLASIPLLASGATARATADDGLGVHRLAAGWRDASSDRFGIVEVDWGREQVRIVSDLPAPGRVHGLLAMPDGGFVAVANRPGEWLVRCDAQGRVMARRAKADESPVRTFNGHVMLSHDGRWLFSTETGSPVEPSWVSVRDARSLERVGQFSSAGVDAHHGVLDDEGRLFIANGGLLRTADGRKIELDRMRPSLARIDPGTGEVLAQWRLADPRLSLRHLAWSRQADGPALLGVGLQAEHDEPSRVRDAPVLALCDGRDLTLPTHDAQAAGYVGDIAAGPGGGFVLSGQKAARGLWWHPRAPGALTKVAELTEVCALAGVRTDAGTATLIGSARGIALWHPTQPARMLRWPHAMLPDNHWALLAVKPGV